MGNGRLLLPHEPATAGGTEQRGSASGRVYDVERSMAAAAGGALLRQPHHLGGAEQQQLGLLPGGVRRRQRGYPCSQCGKVLRTRAWLTRHVLTCGTDSPFADDTEGMLTDQDSYSEDDTDATAVDVKGGDMSSSALLIDAAATPPSAMSTPPATVCACRDCGKTFKRKTWLLKHALQCVASRVGASSSVVGAGGSGLGAGMTAGGGPNQVGSALTCHHCGKRYLGRYDKYREHVKQCGLRANGGLGASAGGTPTSAHGLGGVATGSGGAGGENACHKCGEAVAGGGEELDKHVAECSSQAGGGTAAENTVHTCPTCGRCYAKRYDYFLRHVRSCQRGDDRGGGMGGGMGGGLGGGEQQTLADGEPCVCPRCSKMYRRADHLWQHMEMCRGIPGRNVGPHVCDKCGKTYGTRYDVLQRHVLTCKGLASGQAAAVEPLLDAMTQAAAQRSILGAAAATATMAREGAAAGGDGSTLADGGGDDALGGGGRVSAFGADDGQARALAEGGGAYDGANGRAGGRILAGGGDRPCVNECLKCGKAFTLPYDQFARHVRKCRGPPTAAGASPDVDAYVCQKCGRGFGREYELYLRHADACDGADDDDADVDDDEDEDDGGQHVCPCCGKTCDTYEELWSHAQTCRSGGALLPEGDEAASAGQEDGGSSVGGGDVGGGGGIGAGGGMRVSSKLRNVCAKCGKGYVLLTCYRKHLAKCMGGGGDATMTNGGMFNGGGGVRRPGDVYGASSGSPSTGSNPADDIDNEDDDAVGGGDANTPYECDNCGLSFGARRSSFLKHVALCTGAAVPVGFPGSGASGGGGSGGGGSLHVCNYCGKHFVRLGNYTRHVQMCQYSGGGGGATEVMRQLHIRQCDRCFEAIPADQFVGHVERCYAAVRAAAAAGSLLHVQPDGGQLQSLGSSGRGEGFAASGGLPAAAALLAAQQQQQAAASSSWTCPRCKKDFLQSGQYIRHISTCSMEFLKCPKCDFGRYYSDSKDFDNHVTVCRGKAGTGAGQPPPGAASGPPAAVPPAALGASATPVSSSPLPVPSVDKPSFGPVAAAPSPLIPSALQFATAAAHNPQSYLASEQHPAAALPPSAMTEAMDCAVPSTDADLQDLTDGAEFALQEEVVAASDADEQFGDAGGSSSEGPATPCDGSEMLA